jgi:hypothetical protein
LAEHSLFFFLSQNPVKNLMKQTKEELSKENFPFVSTTPNKIIVLFVPDR